MLSCTSPFSTMAYAAGALATAYPCRIYRLRLLKRVLPVGDLVDLYLEFFPCRSMWKGNLFSVLINHF